MAVGMLFTGIATPAATAATTTRHHHRYVRYKHKRSHRTLKRVGIGSAAGAAIGAIAGGGKGAAIGAAAGGGAGYVYDRSKKH
jgi:uncharacterized protein YcfJ